MPRKLALGEVGTWVLSSSIFRFSIVEEDLFLENITNLVVSGLRGRRIEFRNSLGFLKFSFITLRPWLISADAKRSAMSSA